MEKKYEIVSLQIVLFFTCNQPPELCVRAQNIMVKQAIRDDHTRSLKHELKGDKLREMANSNISSRREYTGGWHSDLRQRWSFVEPTCRQCTMEISRVEPVTVL